ncbi:MAG: hypothetical protein N2C12_13565, partial [Planctomycetales bacterium]
MPEGFDPYHKWLGIPPKHQPPDHYRLLGIEIFEPDLDVIDHAADQRMVHIKSFQSSAKFAISERILNEVSAARGCLLDPDKKTAYDTDLRAKQPAEEQRAAPSVDSLLFGGGAGSFSADPLLDELVPEEFMPEEAVATNPTPAASEPAPAETPTPATELAPPAPAPAPPVATMPPPAEPTPASTTPPPAEPAAATPDPAAPNSTSPTTEPAASASAATEPAAPKPAPLFSLDAPEKSPTTEMGDAPSQSVSSLLSSTDAAGSTAEDAKQVSESEEDTAFVVSSILKETAEKNESSLEISLGVSPTTDATESNPDDQSDDYFETSEPAQPPVAASPTTTTPAENTLASPAEP